MEAKLLLIPWLASVLYGSIPLFWMIIHPFAGRWRRQSTNQACSGSGHEI
jgi:hypothetical protein